jgi:hypothetical protein
MNNQLYPWKRYYICPSCGETLKVRDDWKLGSPGRTQEVAKEPCKDCRNAEPDPNQYH